MGTAMQTPGAGGGGTVATTQPKVIDDTSSPVQPALSAAMGRGIVPAPQSVAGAAAGELATVDSEPQPPPEALTVLVLTTELLTTTLSDDEGVPSVPPGAAFEPPQATAARGRVVSASEVAIRPSRVKPFMMKVRFLLSSASVAPA
jgi:hypothetical protein